MKSSNNEQPVLLSKHNSRSLLVRNAIDQDTLRKQARLLEKEKNSGERLFLKKREHLLQRQVTRILETSQSRPSSSCSLENVVTKWKNAATLARECSQSPKPRRKEIDGSNKQMRPFSSLSLQSDNDDKKPRFTTRNKTFPSLASEVSLPDIHATSNGITRGKKYNVVQRSVSNCRENTGDGSCTETAVCIGDDWKSLRKCRYLRASQSAEEDICGI